MSFLVLIAFLPCIIWLYNILYFFPFIFSILSNPFFLEPSLPLYSLYQFASRSAEHSVTGNLSLPLSWFGSTVSVSCAFLFLCLHSHFSGVCPQVSPKNRCVGSKIWIVWSVSVLCSPTWWKIYIIFWTANSFSLEFLRNCCIVFKHPMLLISLVSVLCLSFFTWPFFSLETVSITFLSLTFYKFTVMCCLVLLILLSI